MASDALHLMLVDRFEEAPGLPPALRQALKGQQCWLRLGSVLIDLPYFDRFLRRAWDDLRGHADRPSFWGDRFHREGSVRLVGALLRNAQRAGDPAALLALAIGLRSHTLLDCATHPQVNQAAGALGGQLGAAHRALEDAQAERFCRLRRNRWLFGHPATAALFAVRGEALAHGELAASLTHAVSETFGWAPGRRDWLGWALGFWEYGLVMSGGSGWFRARRALARTRGHLEPAGAFAARFDRCRAQLAADAGDLFGALGGAGLAPAVFQARFPERNLDFPELPPEASPA